MQLGICVLLGLAASVEDLWRRKISNLTVLAGSAAGLALQVALRGWWSGLEAWAAGTAIGFGIFLIFFLAGGMGAGDIKLMAAFGSCLGLDRILWAALWTAMVGAVVACGYLAWKWFRRRAGGGDSSPASRSQEAIPYAPAIFLGALLSLASR